MKPVYTKTHKWYCWYTNIWSSCNNYFNCSYASVRCSSPVCHQLAGYLKEVVAQSGLELKFGLVQTAYANGSSTDYINNKLVRPCC